MRPPTRTTNPLCIYLRVPRVGDLDFTKAFAKYVRNRRRIANLFDVVTHAPPHIYKMPKREKKYYYSHVHTQWPLTFQNGSVSGNHVIGSYYAELAKLQPEFADRLSLTNPEFCPVGESPLEKV